MNGLFLYCTRNEVKEETRYNMIESFGIFIFALVRNERVCSIYLRCGFIDIFESEYRFRLSLYYVFQED
jgi:hypothetical protein